MYPNTAKNEYKMERRDSLFLNIDFSSDESSDGELDSLEVELEVRESAGYCDEQGPAPINQFLFLGSVYHATTEKCLKENQIGHILNVSQDTRCHFQDTIHYKNLPVYDTCEEDIAEIFQQAFNYLDQVRASGGKVLVHCHAGVSRSATICIAYLMREQKINVRTATQIVSNARPCIAPNFGFSLALEKFQETLSIKNNCKASL